MLNRVTGGNLTELQGKLLSNGQVWLVNPAGIYIGTEALIETASFLASTFDVLDSEFLARREVYLSGCSEPLTHLGTIRCPTGTVHLLAKTVELSGKVEARCLEVGAAPKLLLVSEDAHEFRIAIDPHLSRETPYGYAISADGDLWIGEKMLFYCDGELLFDGRVNGKNVTVDLFADQIHVASQAIIELAASDLKIGGSSRGEDPLVPHASVSWIDSGATIDLSGQGKENGGDFVLWGNRAVHFEGTLRSDSGSEGGRGGMAEVSSCGYFHCTGPISLKGVDGWGTLLFDPVTVTISGSATSNAVIGNPSTFSADTAVINSTDLQNYLENTGNVSINAVAAAGSGTGNVSLQTSVTWTTPHTLSITGQDVTFNANVTSTSTAMGTGPRLDITAVRSFSLTSSCAIAGDGTNPAIRIQTQGGASGSYTGITIQAALSSSNGDIVLSGIGGTTGSTNRGVFFTVGSSLSVADGKTATITGVGRGSAAEASNQNIGVSLSSGSIAVGSSTGGTLILTGTGGGGTGGSHQGVLIANTITLNGASALRLINCQGGGGASTNTSSNYGVRFSSATVTGGAGASVRFGNITGGGNGTGTGNAGVQLTSSSVVAGQIIMDDGASLIRGGTSNGFAPGFELVSSSTLGNNTVTSQITLTCQGGGSTSSLNHGISFSGSSFLGVANGGVVRFTGTGGGSLSGGGASNSGISMSSTTVNLGTSAGATIYFKGYGGFGTSGVNGVSLAAMTWNFNGGGLLEFEECLGGSSSTNTSSSHGISVTGANTTNQLGAIFQFRTVTGGGSGTGTSNQGLDITSSFAAPTMRMADGASVIRGGTGTTGCNGINITGAGALGNSSTTTMTLRAVAQSGSSSRSGFSMGGGTLQIGDGGTLNLHCTGGGAAGQTGGCHGITITGGTINIGSSESGTGTFATFTGIGGMGNSGCFGVTLSSSITAFNLFGAATLLFTDCLGGGLSNGANSGSNVGVVIGEPIISSNANSKILFGSITGGGSLGGSNNHGLNISGATIAAGEIRMNTPDDEIRSGSTSGLSMGIAVDGGSLGNSATRLINLKARSLATATSSIGIRFQTSAGLTVGDLGSITLRGTGGGAAASAVGNCHGVSLSSGSITLGSTGSADAELTITGIGGSGTSGGHNGVVFGPSSVTLNGSSSILFLDCVGGGTGHASNVNFCRGVHFPSGSITITAASPAAAMRFANITGGGSLAGISNHGVEVAAGLNLPNIIMDPDLDVTHIRSGQTTGAASSGIVIIATMGGNNTFNVDLIGVSQSASSNSRGVLLSTGGVISIPDTGSFTFEGQGGGATEGATTNCDGISFGSGVGTVTIGSSVASSAQLRLIGRGGAGSGGSHFGVNFTPSIVNFNGGSQLIFNNCVGGSVGDIANASSSNYGVNIGTTISNSNSASSISFTNITGGGNAGNTGADNYGVFVSGVSISAGSISGSITGGAGAGVGNAGLVVSGSSLGSSSNTSVVNITAQGGTAGSGSAHGILVTAGGKIQSGSTGSITLVGAGGSGSNSYGIRVTGVSSAISAVDGGVSISGSITSAPSLYGVVVEESGSVSRTGAGNLSITSAGSSSIGLGNCSVSGGSGTLTFASPVTLIAATPTITGSSSINFASSVNGAAPLSVSGGAINFAGVVGNLAPLTSINVPSATSATFLSDVTTTGSVNLTASAVGIDSTFRTSGGAILFDGPVSLEGPSLLDTTNSGGTAVGANVTVGGTINGNQALTIDAGTGGIVSLQGSIGDSISLNALDISGLLIQVPSLVRAQGGTLVFRSPVVLSAHTTFTDSGTTGISFLSSIDGGAVYDVGITAPNGAVTVVGTLEGRSLSCTAGLNATFSSTITSHGHVTITSDERSVIVHTISSNGGNISLQPGAGFSNSPLERVPDGILQLRGVLDAGAGAISLSSAGRSQLLSVATITGNPSGADVTVLGSSLTVGINETITVFGDINFLISGASQFGDLVATGSITVSSGANTVYLHSPGQIYNASGLLQADGETSIVAAASVPSISPAPGTIGPGALFRSEKIALSSAEFESLLTFGGYLLSYAIPPLPVPASSSSVSRAEVVFNSTVATQEMLENWGFPYPLMWVIRSPLNPLEKNRQNGFPNPFLLPLQRL
jgi:hypothetical protein